MGSLKTIAFASVIAIVSSTKAGAADLPPPPPMPDYPPVEVGGGWYLRGDIGLTDQSVDRLSNSLDATIEKIDLGFDSSPFVGGGVGYQFNPWLRIDATGEYRGKASFHGLERYRDRSLPLGFGTDDYSATKSEYVGLVNAYFDLGNWYGVMPFVGAGVGGARIEIDHFRDTNIVTQGLAFARSNSEWDFAWALYAGLGYQVTPNLTLELAYRYLNLGDARTGTVLNYAGRCERCESIQFKDIDSHDVKIGMRWALAAPPPPPPIYHHPVVSKY